MAIITGAPLYNLLPDPEWKTGDPFAFGEDTLPAGDPPIDPAEYDAAFAHEVIDANAIPCSCNGTPCLRCRVVQLLNE